MASAIPHDEIERSDLRRDLAELEAKLRERDERIRRLDEQLIERGDELRTVTYQHHLTNRANESSLRQAAARLVGMAGIHFSSIDQGHLIPWNHLDRDEATGPNAWRVARPRAYFIADRMLPAGWLHIELHLQSDQVGEASIAFDTGMPGAEPVLLERVPVHGRADHSRYVYLPQPVRGLRFYPLDVTGRIQVESFAVRALSAPAALVHALHRKLALLSGHGLLQRSLLNAVRMVGRAEFRALAQKLYGGLVYRGRMSPAQDTETPAKAVEETRKHLAFAPAGVPLNPGGKGLPIVYVLRSAGLCGGVKVVLEHASRLYARGHDVTVFHLEGNPSWFPWRVPTRRIVGIPALRQALNDFRGIKVATWYETAPWVAASLKSGDRGYYLVQDIEESYGDTAAQATAALDTYSLGLRPITEGLWVRRQLKERFGLDSLFVSIGLDQQRYGPQLVLREPQRILTQSRTWSGGVSAGTRIKGWDTARDAILHCHTANPRTTLTTFSIEEAQSFPPELSHIHYQAPSDTTLAQLYGQAGIYLLTSRHEGFGLTAAEAMACGCPVVATQAHGNEEFCIDGVTALTAPVGDAEMLGRHCLRLQNDPAFAQQLGKAGQDFIRQYTWDRVIDRLEREFLEREGPEVIIETPRTETTSETPAPSLAVPASIRSSQRGQEYPDLRLRASSFVDWSIVIPTLGKPDLVTACVSSCRRFIPDGVSVQFIVVDDGSSDATVVQGLRAAAREHDFQLLFNHQNLGFSASVNRGMRRARGRYVVLCNNDVVFHQPWLEPLEQLFQRDPQVGIAGARLLYPDGMIQHAGMDKAKASLSWFHTHGKQPGDTPAACQTRYVWAVTGALFAVRRSVLERLGGLSTAYATAYEDLDYCLYAWANGVRVAYGADVCAYHLEGHTRGATEAEKRHRPIWAERERAGRAYFEKKWAFLRHIEDFRVLLSLAERGAELPAFATEQETAA